MLTTEWPCSTQQTFQRWLKEILTPQQIDDFLQIKEFDGAHAFPFVRVRRGSCYAVRATPSHALGHSSCGTLATSSGSSVVSFSLLAVECMGRMLGLDQQRRTSSGSLWSYALLGMRWSTLQTDP